MQPSIRTFTGLFKVHWVSLVSCKVQLGLWVWLKRQTPPLIAWLLARFVSF